MGEYGPLFEQMGAEGIVRITAEYSGSDDEGYVSNLRMYNEQGRCVGRGDETSSASDHHPLADSVIAFINGELWRHSPGWETNEGAQGSVEIDVRTGVAKFDYAYFDEPVLHPDPFVVTLDVNVETPLDRLHQEAAAWRAIETAIDEYVARTKTAIDVCTTALHLQAQIKDGRKIET